MTGGGSFLANEAALGKSAAGLPHSIYRAPHTTVRYACVPVGQGLDLISTGSWSLKVK
jgi:hypothetical protein